MKIERVEVTYGELRTEGAGNRKVQVTYGASCGETAPDVVESELMLRAITFVEKVHSSKGPSNRGGGARGSKNGGDKKQDAQPSGAAKR